MSLEFNKVFLNLFDEGSEIYAFISDIVLATKYK